MSVTPNSPASTNGPVSMRHPLVDLMARYAAVLSAAWQHRDQLAGPKRLADEAAFLPAALSLQETPVHPAARRTAIAICALFAFSIAWSYFGQIDIVAVAPGRIVVSQRTKTIQPLETSVVKQIHVKDGDLVKVGQVLIELDATSAQADSTRVDADLWANETESARAQMLMEALTHGSEPKGSAVSTPDSVAQLRAEWQDITAKLAKFRAEAQRRQAEKTTADEIIAKLKATLPLARQRERDFLALTEQGFMSGHSSQDRTRERVEMERDLATAQARAAEAQATLVETQRAEAAYRAETQRNLRERKTQADLKRGELTQEQAKARQRTQLTQLTAPVAGTVQQLAVHTQGGVVTPAQALMVIVPDDANVTAEVTLENKDIGFVNEGKTATIKLETFPFTRYGTIEAKVKRVSADAVVDEKRGAVFPATLELATTALDVDGKTIHLAPGMNLTAEVRTGKRRVIDFLLNPLHQHTNESMRER